VRLDEDAELKAEALAQLLEQYTEVSYTSPFFFFSGTYGESDGELDLLNDYAVRTHWFIDLASQKLDDELIRIFLSDLSQLGSTQITEANTSYSDAMDGILNDTNRKRMVAARRLQCQVISGAGLIMPSKAVNLLPPFMNVKDLTIWIDDSLKRRLHEAISDLSENDLECVSSAKIKQDRYPGGINQGWIDFAKREYFDRLLRGCMLHRIISKPDGKPTNYSNLLGDIVRFRVIESSPQLDAQGLPDLRRVSESGPQVNLRDLRDDMTACADERYDEVYTCWSSDEYRGYALFDWATSLPDDHKSKQCGYVVNDAFNYMKLVLKWPIFTRAIERLRFEHNYWLFEPVD
jgi:hypothetical protein